jgi:hypothetical protein
LEKTVNPSRRIKMGYETRFELTICPKLDEVPDALFVFLRDAVAFEGDVKQHLSHDQGDLWDHYYLGGRIQRCPAQITYEPFDPRKLKLAEELVAR